MSDFPWFSKIHVWFYQLVADLVDWFPVTLFQNAAASANSSEVYILTILPCKIDFKMYCTLRLLGTNCHGHQSKNSQLSWSIISDATTRKESRKPFLDWFAFHFYHFCFPIFSLRLVIFWCTRQYQPSPNGFVISLVDQNTKVWTDPRPARCHSLCAGVTPFWVGASQKTNGSNVEAVIRKTAILCNEIVWSEWFSEEEESNRVWHSLQLQQTCLSSAWSCLSGPASMNPWLNNNVVIGLSLWLLYNSSFSDFVNLRLTFHIWHFSFQFFGPFFEFPSPQQVGSQICWSTTPPNGR